MTEKPYIGITGPVLPHEVDLIINEFQKADITFDSPHIPQIPMLGFLVSYKTLNDLPTKNRRYPNFENLRFLLEQANNRVFTTVHYNTRDKENLANEVSRVFEGIYEDGLCRGIQLNVVWPSLDQIRQIKREFPDMKIIFQGNQKVLSSGTPQEVVRRIKEYQSDVSYLLIDPSGGRGKEFDIDSSVDIYQELKEQIPDLMTGFAGGFTGDNVIDRTETLINKIKTSKFSIDAEGGLRDKISPAYGDDLLNPQKVNGYVSNSAWVFK